MKRLRVLLVLLCVLLPMMSMGSADAKAKSKPVPRLSLSISNFRFCKATSCNPQDTGYIRSSSAPVADNPFGGTIGVKSGTLVTWVYRDSLCDQLGCPGHNIIFEDGKAGVRKGVVPPQTGRTINVKITSKPGTTIRYFCSVSSHYMFGMTGILKVT